MTRIFSAVQSWNDWNDGTIFRYDQKISDSKSNPENASNRSNHSKSRIAGQGVAVACSLTQGDANNTRQSIVTTKKWGATA